jgi:hypothetical protein
LEQAGAALAAAKAAVAASEPAPTSQPAEPATTQATSEPAPVPAIDPALEQAVVAAQQAVTAAEAQMAAMTNQTADADAAAAAADAAMAASQQQMDTMAQQLSQSEQTKSTAAKALADAQAASIESANPVHPDLAAAIAASLREFAPHTDAATTAVEQQLAPPLAGLQQALAGADAVAAGTTADQAIAAVEAARAALATSMQTVVDRQPLDAAEHFAHVAAEALSAAGPPPNLEAAVAEQQRASQSLTAAWERSIRRASTERLRGLSVMGSLFTLYSTIGAEVGDTMANASGRNGASGAAMAPPFREWGRFLPRNEVDLNASIRDDAPPGFQDALRAYFETLGGAAANSSDQQASQ